MRPQEAPEIENPIWIWWSLLEDEMDTYEALPISS